MLSLPPWKYITDLESALNELGIPVELEAYERGDTWEMERVVLERMRGNPAARPAPAGG